MASTRDARLADLDVIEDMIADFVKGHPAESHRRSREALQRAYFGEPLAKLYERVAIGHESRECHLSGKAFVRMAELDGLPIREAVRGLPPPELGLEPADD